VLLRAAVRLGGQEFAVELCSSSRSFRFVGFRNGCPPVREYWVLTGVDLVVAGESTGLDGWGLGFAACYTVWVFANSTAQCASVRVRVVRVTQYVYC
jgi:hypothetical protein